jgi:hypothetical protein
MSMPPAKGILPLFRALGWNVDNVNDPGWVHCKESSRRFSAKIGGLLIQPSGRGCLLMKAVAVDHACLHRAAPVPSVLPALAQVQVAQAGTGEA